MPPSWVWLIRHDAGIWPDLSNSCNLPGPEVAPLFGKEIGADSIANMFHIYVEHTDEFAGIRNPEAMSHRPGGVPIRPSGSAGSILKLVAVSNEVSVPITWPVAGSSR